MTSPWLSVVTVVKDDVPGFHATVQSIAEQNLEGLEYLVIDGSTDSQSIRDALGASSLEPLALLSVYAWAEPEGIYQAMNTGLSLAKGTFIYFLNAGDVLVNTSVIDRVHKALASSNSLWAYAPVEMEDEAGATVTTPPWDFAAEARYGFARGHFPCHQGTFVQTQLLRTIGGFDTSFAIAADYAAFLKLARTARPLEINDVVARFSEGGTSTRRWRQSIFEFHRARRTIIGLRGTDLVRDFYYTAVQFVRVGLYRGVVKKWRTP